MSVTIRDWAARDSVRRLARVVAVVLFKGLVVGTIIGVHTFMYYQPSITPAYLPQWLSLSVIVVTAAAVVVVQENLTRGIAISFIALAVAFLIHAAAWVSPLYAAGFDPMVVQLLLPRFSGRGLLSALWFIPFAYAGGYFTMLTIYGYFVE